MSWIITSISANACIMVLEYLYRTNGYSLLLAVKVVPLIITMQLLLWFTWRNGPHLLIVWAVFTLGNTVLRLANTHFLVGEVITPGMWAGLSLMVAGTYVIQSGRW